MHYKLNLGVEPSDALRACAREQLDDALSLLGDERARDPAKAVHEARKDLKKARAVLRLARPALRSKAYRRENGALRDAGRLMSAARDADVLVTTMEGLAERFVGQLPEAAFARLRERLTAEAEASRAAADQTIVTTVVAALEDAAARVESWPLDDADPQTLTAGAARAYARGRAAMKRATAEPTVENLHEWRKRVKYLWSHTRLLEDAWPVQPRMPGPGGAWPLRRARRDHDLAVLADRLVGHEGVASQAPVDDDAVVELAEQRRAELKATAMRLGQRLYAEKPKAFKRRLRAYLRVAIDEQPSATAA